jgi:hypothetical protein
VRGQSRCWESRLRVLGVARHIQGQERVKDTLRDASGMTSGIRSLINS